MVYSLAVKNKFYEDDIYANLNDFSFPPSVIKKYSTINATKSKKNKMMHVLNKHTKELNDEWSVNGLLLFNNTEIIGFLFYNLDKINLSLCEFTFLLIDEENQRKGYGSLLMKHFIEKIIEKPLLIRLKTNEKEKMWYKKFGFQEKNEIIFKDDIEGLTDKKNEYEMLYLLTQSFIDIMVLMKMLVNKRGS